MLGKSFKRHGFPLASTNRAESGSLASSAWHTASCEKSFRGDPVVLSQSDVMSVTTALQSSEPVLVLRMITTNTIAAVRQRSCGTPTPVLRRVSHMLLVLANNPPNHCTLNSALQDLCSGGQDTTASVVLEGNWKENSPERRPHTRD
jgi:hypothetical protein